MTAVTLASRLDAVFALDPAASAVEFKGRGITWGELARTGAEVEAALQAGGVDRSAPIGWIARNRPGAIAAFASLVRNGRSVVPLRPLAAPAAAKEIEAQKTKAVIGFADDWAVEDLQAAAKALGCVGISLSNDSPSTAKLVPGLERAGAGPFHPPTPQVVMQRMTSGTTGAPKRIPVTEAVLIPALRTGEQSKAAAEETELKLKRSPAILMKPFSHAGGLFGLLLALYQARPMILFERFTVEDWVASVERFKPKSAMLVPTMIKMVLASDVKKEALSSLLAIRAGTAPLDPETQIAFEKRFGIPILIDYGAAEFLGGVASWSIGDYRKFGDAKRGSVGRPRPDVHVAIVSPETGAEMPTGEIGLLRIKCDRFGPDWSNTNDYAAIDADRFLFLHGRADDAINRGGFKILPEEVGRVLRQVPGVRDACVIGMPDERLGQVPVAAIEPMPGTARPSAAAMDAAVRAQMPSYMVPVEFRFFDALPRTASLKVARPELRALLGAGAGDPAGGTANAPHR